MKGQCSEKLTERFVGLYKIKAIISSNAVELDLPATIKIHPVVNVSRICRYTSQVEKEALKGAKEGLTAMSKVKNVAVAVPNHMLKV